MKTTIVKNRKIPTLYELGLYGYYGAISLISAVLSYPLSGYFMGNINGKIDFCLSIFITIISACLVFVAFIICGGIPLTEWLDEKEMKVTISINTFFRDKIQKDGFKTYIIATLIIVALMWLNNVGENTIPGFILVYLFFVFISIVCLIISSDDEYRRTHPE